MNRKIIGWCLILLFCVIVLTPIVIMLGWWIVAGLVSASIALTVILVKGIELISK